MKKNKKTLAVTLIIALLLAAAIVSEIVLVFRMTTKLSRESGLNRLEAISGELEKTISDAKNNTMKLAVASQPLMNGGSYKDLSVSDRQKLEDFIVKQKQEYNSSTEGVCYNTYIAGSDWFIIPDFDAPADYVVSKRTWYAGAVKNHGEVFVTDPYIDALTGNICYTVSVALADNSTVVAMDYTMANIRQHIRQMYSDGDRDAVIVTDEGIIAGCSDENKIGKELVREIPEYAGIFSLVKSSDESVSVSQQRDNLFAARSGFGWCLIVSENDQSLYWTSYVQMLAMLIVSVAVFGLITILYVMSVRSARRAKETLTYRDEFLKKAVGELQEPLSRISNCASEANIRHSSDYEQEFDNIREAAVKLSDKVEAIRSYSKLVISSEQKKATKKKVRDIRMSRHFRSVILAALLLVLGISIYVNISASSKYGDSRMQKEVSNYEYKLSEWINTQKSTLDMFCSVISTRPGILDDYNAAVSLLDDITKQHPEISASYMTNPELEHTVYMNNGWQPDENWHVEDREWYKDTLASEEGWNISSPYYDEQTGLYCVTFSERVYDNNTGKFLGNFGIDFYMDKLVDILGSSYSDDGYAFLTDASGEIINHPNGNYQMKKDGSTNIIGLSYNDVKPDGSTVEFFTDYDGSGKLMIASRNNASNFTVFVVKRFWATYGGVFVNSAVIIAILCFCIVLVYKLMSNLIKLQDNANLKLQESAAAAIAADEAKSSFLAQMSHEIRTPINAVLGMNEMILRESSDSAVREYAVNIRSAGRTLLSLINSILDFSKIEDGKMEIIPVNYDTAEMIHDLVSSISSRAASKGLELNVKADPSLPVSLRGDDVRIRQVISNLLTNAVKYTERGSVTLTIKGDNRTEDSIDLCVEVTDTGIGIREEDIGALFESFRRLEEKRNRNIEGTGLGMSIVTKLLDMMNSKLDVSSVYGEGSTFSFRLRQGIVSDEEMGDYSVRMISSGMPEDSGKHLYAPEAKVLVTDDNEMNLKVASSLMKLYGIIPDTAISGMEAISMIADRHYDVIFLDHMMPKLDGIETLAKLREDGLLKEGTPVIALTANAIVGAKEMYLHAGFDDYLTKPIESSVLERMLSKLLPKEKVSFRDAETKAVREEEPAEEDSFTLTELYGIREKCPQLDLLMGLGYCMDSKEFYLDTLEGYLEADKRGELEKAFADRDIKNYGIIAHSLKSTSLTVGAVLLSEHAKAMEFAAKREDAGYIDNNHDELIKEYSGLLEGIGKVLMK
ncbi:MAG: response regulator [Ruminococcus sp.]|nr:response regulator [Ruminococcus sp.]